MEVDKSYHGHDCTKWNGGERAIISELSTALRFGNMRLPLVLSVPSTHLISLVAPGRPTARACLAPRHRISNFPFYRVNPCPARLRPLPGRPTEA